MNGEHLYLYVICFKSSGTKCVFMFYFNLRISSIFLNFKNRNIFSESYSEPGIMADTGHK